MLSQRFHAGMFREQCFRRKHATTFAGGLPLPLALFPVTLPSAPALTVDGYEEEEEEEEEERCLPAAVRRLQRSPDPPRRSSFPFDRTDDDERSPVPGTEEKTRSKAALRKVNSMKVQGTRPGTLALGTPAAREASKSFWSSAMLHQQLEKIVRCAEFEHSGARGSVTSQDVDVECESADSKYCSQDSLQLPPLPASRSLSAPPTPPESPRPPPLTPRATHVSPPARLASSSSSSSSSPPTFPRRFQSVPRRGSVHSAVSPFIAAGYVERMTPPFLSPRLVRRIQPITARRAQTHPLTPPISLQGRQLRLSPKLAPLRKASSDSSGLVPCLVLVPGGAPLLQRQASTDSAPDDGFCE